MGLQLKKATHVDEREIYLLVEGEGFASLVICKPNQEKQAFLAAAQIVRAATFAQEFCQALDRDTSQAQKELQQAAASDRNLEAARIGLERARAHLSEAESGKQRLS